MAASEVPVYAAAILAEAPTWGQSFTTADGVTLEWLADMAGGTGYCEVERPRDSRPLNADEVVSSFEDWAARERLDTDGPMDAAWVARWAIARGLAVVERRPYDLLADAARLVVDTITGDDETRHALGEHFLFAEVEPLAILAQRARDDDRAQSIMLAWAIADSCPEDHADELAEWGIIDSPEAEGWAITGPVTR